MEAVKKTGFKGTMNLNGRPKGSKNIPNKERLLLKALLNYVIDDKMERFSKALDSLNEKDFVNIFIEIYKLKMNDIDKIDANDALINIFREKVNKQINN
jgi:hypothetical protein